MKKTISGKIVLDTEQPCSKCGKRGAFDLTTDFLCFDCMPKWEEPKPSSQLLVELGQLVNISSIIRNEADECASSSVDMRNAPENRNIFHIASIILKGISDKLDNEKSK